VTMNESSHYVVPHGDLTYVHKTPNGPVAGIIETGPNMKPWGWTVGLGWHTKLPTYEALLADPAFGVNVRNEGRPASNLHET